MLNDELIERILASLPGKTIGLLGDLFLDRYLDIDSTLTERSIETALDAYQVTSVRSYPGALGTVINNLAALGVGRIVPFAIIGDDGEGYELRQALARLPAVSTEGLISWPGRRTPTYTKPMLAEPGRPPRELNRLDIKNRTPTPAPALDSVWKHLERAWPRVDALIVVDQVSEPECGVVTKSVSGRIADLGGREPECFILADSREQIGLFRNVHIKPNSAECLRATGRLPNQWPEALAELAERCGRGVFCTRGEHGIALKMRDTGVIMIPAFPVNGPTDIVGAGDSTSAGIACAMVAGATPAQGAAFGNVVASITIQQIGTTGTATPAQVRERWRQVKPEGPHS
jgi:bifunctional ADP-heptose synthase (sugar kinase/adenylyltransferase)